MIHFVLWLLQSRRSHSGSNAFSRSKANILHKRHLGCCSVQRTLKGSHEDSRRICWPEPTQIHQIPPDPHAGSIAITFSDGSKHSTICYQQAVLYLRWNCTNGVIVRLVESKAKLTSLNRNGDPMKVEICGAVFATWLKTYFQKHCWMKVEQWFHLVDSRLQRERYQTFFANRVGEIQSSTNVQDWWWIPGSANIADIITRGASPAYLTKEAVGSKFPSIFWKWVARKIWKWCCCATNTSTATNVFFCIFITLSLAWDHF